MGLELTEVELLNAAEKDIKNLLGLIQPSYHQTWLNAYQAVINRIISVGEMEQEWDSKNAAINGN